MCQRCDPARKHREAVAQDRALVYQTVLRRERDQRVDTVFEEVRADARRHGDAVHDVAAADRVKLLDAPRVEAEVAELALDVVHDDRPIVEALDDDVGCDWLIGVV